MPSLLSAGEISRAVGTAYFRIGHDLEIRIADAANT